MVFSASSQVIIVAPILPRIGEALSIARELQGTLVTSYAVMLSLFALLTGPISDKFGRRLVLLVGTAAMAVALGLHAFADSYLSLLTMRGVAGAAGGMLSGAAVSYVGDYFPYEKRGWANGWIMSGIAVGQIIGIPLGTILADLFGFRWPFLLFAITMAGAFVLIWRVVPQPPVRLDPNRLSLGRAVRAYAGLLRAPTTAAATAIYFLMFFSIGLYIIYLPTWLEEALDIAGPEIASLFFVGGIANVVTGPYAGRLSDRIGRKPLIIASCIGFGIVMLLTTVVVVQMWVAYVLFSSAMIMFAMRISPLQSLMSALVPAERRGLLMSMAVAVGQVGTGIGAFIAGITYTSFGYVSNTIIGAVAILLMGLLVSRSMPEPEGE